MKGFSISRIYGPKWFRNQYPWLTMKQSQRIAVQHSYHWSQMSLEAQNVILNMYFRRGSEGKTA